MRVRKAFTMLSILLLPGVAMGCTVQDRSAWLRSLAHNWATPTDSATQSARHTQQVTVVYLPFQRGFMAYAEGGTCLYAFADGIILPREVIAAYNNYRYCLPFSDLPEAQAGAPEDPFGQIWSRYVEVRAALGTPAGEVVRYQASVPPSDPVIMGGVFYAGIITLPDGSMLYCGTRAATAGTCQLRSP